MLGFARADLEAGKRARIDFAVHAERSSFVGLVGHRIVESGEIILSAGLSLTDRTAEASVMIIGPERRVDGARIMQTPVEIHRI